jgi:uncharacterized membrane protein HdeD (DUF308 family)
MLRGLAKYWWAIALRGVVAVLFGLMLMFRPGLSLATLVLLFGAYMLVDGVLTTFGAISGRKENDHWGMLLVGGLLSVLLGLLTFRAPGVAAIALLVYIAAWAIVTGVTLIAAGIRLRKEIESEWFLITGGVLAVLWGFWLLWNPAAGALGILWTMGIFAIAFGVAMILLAFRLKGMAAKLGKAVEGIRQAATGA